MLRELMPWTRGTTRLAPRREPADTDLFSQLHRDIDRLFDEVWHGFGAPGFAASGGNRLTPRIDLAETEKEIEVTAELPGLDEKDVEVTLADGLLTIKGEKKSERTEEGKDVYVSERSYGSFQRVVQLPQGVDVDKVTADFSKGVLTVRVPKLPELQANSKKIEIRSR
jgi:HSP20 family protein